MTRIIYLDIDGTLRDEVHGIQPGTVRALEQCRALGIYIVLCTGRNPGSIQPDVRRLKTDGVIAGDGCFVWVKGKQLRRVSFSAETAGKALALAARTGAGLSMETEEGIFMNGRAAGFYTRDFERKLSGCSWPELVRRRHSIRYEDNLADLRPEETPVHKICLMGSEDDIRQMEELLKGCSRTVQRGIWNGCEYLELLPPGCGKGSAVRMVNRCLGIPKEDSLCFGDGENDLDMFQAAGIRVAVRGSCPALVGQADSLCGPPGEDGIARELARRGILPSYLQMQKGESIYAAEVVAERDRISNLSQELL